ncbi:unnamed protein product [Caretta caretta]
MFEHHNISKAYLKINKRSFIKVKRHCELTELWLLITSTSRDRFNKLPCLPTAFDDFVPSLDCKFASSLHGYCGYYQHRYCSCEKDVE